MEINSKIFWRSAVKGGTIIGLVSVGFALLKYAISFAEVSFWSGFAGLISFVVFVMLIYGFTRKMSAMADPETGFSFGRCISFVAAMMLFTGIIEGVYYSIFNNFIAPESVMAAIDVTMLNFQDLVPDGQFDAMYDMMGRWMLNPIYLVFAYILTNLLQGVFFGLFTSAFAQRKPNIWFEGQDALPASDDTDDNAAGKNE